MSYADRATPTGSIVTGTNFSYAAGPGALKGLVVNVGASGTTTVVAYDTNTGTAAGKVLFQASAIFSSNYPSFSADFCEGIIFNSGLCIVVTGNGTSNAYFVAGG